MTMHLHTVQEHLKQKSFVPEKCWSIACSKDGSLCAAGGDSGRIHLWDTTVGTLILSWPAHHKKITAIALSDAGTEIVSGSEDSLVQVWSVAQVVEEQRPRPLYTWSDHAMPISAVVVGAGVSDPYVYSSSLDHKISVRSLVSGRLLQMVTLPVALTALAVDPLEYYCYAGGTNGTTYKVSFVEANIENVMGSREARNKVDELHAECGQITSIALSTSGQHVVVGSEDGSIFVWDTLTCQQIRKSSIGAPIASLLVIEYPLGMAGRGRGQAPESEFRMMPLGNFSKTVGSSGVGLKPWQTSMVLIDTTLENSSNATDTTESGLGYYSTVDEQEQVTVRLKERITHLEEENALLLEQKNRAVSLLKKK